MISVKNVRIDRIVVFPGSAQAEKLQKHVIAFQMLMQESHLMLFIYPEWFGCAREKGGQR